MKLVILTACYFQQYVTITTLKLKKPKGTYIFHPFYATLYFKYTRPNILLYTLTESTIYNYMGIGWGAPYRGNHLWGFYYKFPRNARM